MTITVTLAGESVQAAPLDRAAVQVMLDAGALPNQGRVELIDGALLPMAPANTAHAATLARLTYEVFGAVGGSKQVLVDPAFFLADDLMLAPDILVLPQGAALPEARGDDADLVIEISHSSLSFDLRLKAERYGRHGVAEYWVIDLENRQTHIHRAPAGDGFADVTPHPWSVPVQAKRLPELTLLLSEIL